MIMINEKKLEKVLEEVFIDFYGKNSSNYFVLERVNVFVEEFEEPKTSENYDMNIEGRYGREGKNEFCDHFEILIQSSWSYDFIKGYFHRYLEEKC